ncbi:MAG: bifunctional indole-3-glycerol phosphate synthase/phosphoribosylanthranilate isomerase [Spirochaetia bacterium]|jgi:indole-3-glycerol phosphate synthase/phosphoribosylanthranilate isomerase|nr:bifunctional indole-3-glycerol phosphate synthase/phosphoribosylanthranilate isomerase [Spirochaetia bacterium]
MNILEEIVARRKIRVSMNGAAQRIRLPEKRKVPVLPFAAAAGKRCFVIAEVKGKSPSAGIISRALDPVSAARHYADSGISEISVLTEEEYFGGSLQYLLDIKNAVPQIAVLRKDFLLTEEDIDVSWKAGADAVLLIASVLDRNTLGTLMGRASELGLVSLVEVHSAGDVEKIREFKPPLLGINSRNLENFRVDKAHPMMMAGLIDWDASLVFESGIKTPEDTDYAFRGGFSGVLCGEALMKEKPLARQMAELAASYTKEQIKGKRGDEFFWRKLYKGWGRFTGNNGSHKVKPLVKICGITNMEDAKTASDLGADMIGFVFADSPRRAGTGLPEQLSSLDIIKTAVVKNPDNILIEYLKSLYAYHLIDAVQYHGPVSASLCREAGIPYYKSQSFTGKTCGAVLADIPDYSLVYSCPRFLTDSSFGGKEGGTGFLVDSLIVDAVRKRETLWLAGGLSGDNIKAVIERYSPELVDASSRLEKYYGKKDIKKLEKFFSQIQGF